MYSIDICHLYPDLTNSYGDRGNVFILNKRCQWRGIAVNIHNVSIGHEFIPGNYDLVVFGSSQDHEKQIIIEDLRKFKLDGIKEAVDDNTVFLCISGGYQIMGRKIITAPGSELLCAGILDIITIDFEKRLTGFLAFECDFLQGHNIIGFENHAGRTWLGSNIEPLGKVVHGYGNNGEDGYEGAIYKNVFCSYGHGSLLARNPRLADHLISLAMKRKYYDFTELQPINDELEYLARNAIETQLKIFK